MLRYAYLQYLYPKLVILLHLIKAYLIWSTHINYLGPEECVDKEMLFVGRIWDKVFGMKLCRRYKIVSSGVYPNTYRLSLRIYQIYL